MSKQEGNGRSELAALIDTRLNDIASHKMQRDVAMEVGFPSLNVMSAIKRGATKLSLDRVEAMARALELDLPVLMIPALRQYFTDDVIEAIRNTFNSTETKTERDILEIAQKNMDVNEPLSKISRDRLKEVFASNRPMGH